MPTVNGTTGDDQIDVDFIDASGNRIDTAPGATNRIIAGNGEDTVTAGAGDDTIEMGADADFAYAGAGNDTVYGNEGDDFLRGGEGDDVLYGGTGNDTLKGDDGADTIYGGEGVDFIGGGADADVIVGGTAGDLIYGGEEGDDNDTLDLSGLAEGSYRVVDLVTDANGNGYNGTVEFLGQDGKPTGESFRFEEIEHIKTDPPVPPAGPDGTVEGTSGNDVIDLGYDGDPEGDRIDNNDALLPGEVGNDDLVYGYGGDDTIRGLDGNDEIYGGAGNDSISGGAGDDTIFGNTGDDIMNGAAGNDYIQDSSGSDTVYGGSGDDTIRLSGPGDDSILGGSGSDTIYGGIGNDVIDGSAGGLGRFDNPYPGVPGDPDPYDDRDVVYASDGDDIVRTGDDRDTIYGGLGDDTLDAGIDDDLVHGDQGDDTIVGGEGNDEIYGGAGNDLIYGGLDPRFPDELNIRDDEGDLVTDNGMDTIYGGAGDDTVYGEDDDDVIYGGGGNDHLDGQIDDDTIYGGQGDDTVIGGQGNDQLFGGNDRDMFFGGNGGDHVDGGAGGDDFDTLDLTGSGVDFITYTSADREDGIVTFLDGSTMTFEEIENVVPCFTPGTLIATPRGERRVEDLREGDRIITRDNGIQEIRWAGRKEMSGAALQKARHLQPVLIKAGALGNGLPERDITVSPNHRLLVSGDKTQLYFEESEVLAAAKHLVGLPGIHQVEAMSVSYIHFMFDRHEVVLSNGAWTESFQPGDYSLKGIGGAQRAEILELFPELATTSGIEGYASARRSLKKYEARLLVAGN
ncbi:Hint domain-containing protein [Wenxinia saemankumensis]|uniref:Intein N-terminal splicing region n=1 Tax=Wenxinia saemankumensis TaxID=1447782 RepID=A0A1M6A1S1_9RHOB|nr:Hint domain-containing protein [Wenxinia saemankumensis]SHI30430.1 intein N-terminal splicing region [Wenxinia saemankumensis]